MRVVLHHPPVRAKHGSDGVSPFSEAPLQQLQQPRGAHNLRDTFVRALRALLGLRALARREPVQLEF